MKQQIVKYFLILGKACNMKCIYCIQGQDKPVYEVYEQLPDPKNVVKYFPETGYYELVLFGGEPMLYWSFITEFCKLMKERNPNVYLKMTTNGTLLTVERAKKLNEMDVHVSLSHDGKHFGLTRRSKDFLRANPEPYLTLKKRNIVSVYSALNPNFYDIWEYFEEFRIKHGLQKRERIGIRAIKDANGTTPKELFLYNNKDFETMLDRVFIKLEKDLTDNVFDSYEFMHYENALKTLFYRVNQVCEEFGPWCGSDCCVCQIDVYGNLYTCINRADSFGNYRDLGLSVGEKSRYSNDPACKKCPVYVYCGSGCFSCADDRRKYLCYCVYQEMSRLIDTVIKVGGLKNA